MLIGTNDRYLSATTGTGKMEYYNNVAKTTTVLFTKVVHQVNILPYVQYSTPGDYFIFSATAASVIPAGRTIQFTTDFYVKAMLHQSPWVLEI
jgi:hypothetical protein